MTDRRLSHPLCGADIKTLLQVLGASGGIEKKSWPQVAVALGAAFGRLPSTIADYGYTALNAYKSSPAPIFILGHWRSGTTHLYNVLSKSKQFGYVSPFATALPWDFMLLGRLLEPLLKKSLPEHRYIDRVEVKADSPQEDEIGLANMTPLSFYHALYFPEQFERFFNAGVFFDGCSEDEIEEWVKTLTYFYRKLSLRQDNRQLLIKNPVYTARVKLIRSIWPEARFIHIHRNPYTVFFSMRHFYEALFAQFALQPYDHVNIDEVVLSTYTRMMTALVEDTEGLDDSQFIELGFDEFQADPLKQVDRIYSQLGIDGLDKDREIFSTYLEGVSNYKKNRYDFPADTLATISERWQPFIDRWNYQTPD